MHQGFRIVREMIDGLNDYLDEKGLESLRDLIGKSRDTITSWDDLNLNYKIIARVDQKRCIHCNKCYVACEDAAHQCIDRVPRADGTYDLVVDEGHCVGCNLCMMVCPVDCIEMLQVENGLPSQSWNQRQASGAV
jgi:dihydropyrimidine dehydrogenase (NAD+) subunit PreA